MHSYVALSYVWGGSEIFKTRKKNVERLCEANSLSLSNAPLIPRTIRDAFQVTELLGERYLWVDALCIIQDDADSKHNDIKRMSAIFHNAQVTIIAADSETADSGIRGIPGTSGSRSFHQNIIEMTPRVKLLMHPENYSFSKWHTRGWTFQEGVVSRRRLIFHNETVQWECGCTTWHEYSHFSGKGYIQAQILPRGPPTPENIQGVLNRFASMVSNYNDRDLTYQEDVIPAFSGIMSALAPYFKGGFICGLPVALFHIGLVWQPHSAVSRRLPSLNLRSRNIAPTPSWSWTGWKGQLDLHAWVWAFDEVVYQKNPKGVSRVVPIVNWMSHTTPKSAGVPVTMHFDETRNRYMYGNAPLPSGWERHSFRYILRSSKRVLPGHWLGALPNFLYTHISDPKSHYWFPVLPSNATDETLVSNAPYLSCRTRRAWLFGSKRIAPVQNAVVENFTEKFNLSISIRDKENNWMGVLRLHEEAPLESLSGKPLELVEIATGCRFNHLKPEFGIDEWMIEERPKSGPIYEYYHVLWIERIDGICYRKGLGRVLKNGWEAQEREWIDIMLG
jgi:hypothetical protein